MENSARKQSKAAAAGRSLGNFKLEATFSDHVNRFHQFAEKNAKRVKLRAAKKPKKVKVRVFVSKSSGSPSKLVSTETFLTEEGIKR